MQAPIRRVWTDRGWKYSGEQAAAHAIFNLHGGHGASLIFQREQFPAYVQGEPVSLDSWIDSVPFS